MSANKVNPNTPLRTVYSRGIPATPSAPNQPGSLYEGSPARVVGSVYSPKQFRVADIPLDDASYQTDEGVKFPFKGTVVFISWSTNNTDVIEVKIGEDSDFVKMGPGACPVIGGAPFQSLTIRVPTNVAGATTQLVYVTDGMAGPLDELRLA